MEIFFLLKINVYDILMAAYKENKIWWPEISLLLHGKNLLLRYGIHQMDGSGYLSFFPEHFPEDSIIFTASEPFLMSGNFSTY